MVNHLYAYVCVTYCSCPRQRRCHSQLCRRSASFVGHTGSWGGHSCTQTPGRFWLLRTEIRGMTPVISCMSREICLVTAVGYHVELETTVQNSFIYVFLSHSCNWWWWWLFYKEVSRSNSQLKRMVLTSFNFSYISYLADLMFVFFIYDSKLNIFVFWSATWIKRVIGRL